MEKLSEKVYKYVETKISSRYTDIHSLTSTISKLKKASGCGTVKKFIRLGLDPTMGLTLLLWTTVTKATYSSCLVTSFTDIVLDA